MQEPYLDEESQASAQTATIATGEEVSSQANEVAAAPTTSKEPPTFNTLERQTTKYFDAGKTLPLFLNEHTPRVFSGSARPVSYSRTHAVLHDSDLMVATCTFSNLPGLKSHEGQGESPTGSDYLTVQS